MSSLLIRWRCDIVAAAANSTPAAAAAVLDLIVVVIAIPIGGQGGEFTVGPESIIDGVPLLNPRYNSW